MKKVLIKSFSLRGAMVFLLFAVICSCKEETTFINTVKTSSVKISESELNHIEFLDAQTGIVVGKDGVVLKTSDGGLSWKQLNLPLTSGVTFYDADFVGPDTIVLTGADVIDGLIYISTDGGQSFVIPSNLSSIDRGAKFQAIDSKNWVILNKGDIRVSSNAGASWNRNYLPAGQVFQAWLLQFTDAMNGFIIDFDGKLFKTTDAGVSWTQVYSGAAGQSKRVLGGKGNIVYAAGGGTNFYISKNAGTTWQQSAVNMSESGKDLASDGVTIYTVDFLNNTFVASGENALLISKDGGNSFTEYFNSDGSSLVFDGMKLINESTALGVKGGNLIKFNIQ